MVVKTIIGNVIVDAEAKVEEVAELEGVAHVSNVLERASFEDTTGAVGINLNLNGVTCWRDQ